MTKETKDEKEKKIFHVISSVCVMLCHLVGILFLNLNIPKASLRPKKSKKEN